MEFVTEKVTSSVFRDPLVCVEAHTVRVPGIIAKHGWILMPSMIPMCVM